MSDDQARIVSVIGGARRTNRWKVAGETSVLTLFGRCLLDLRDAQTDADELWFSVTSVFASVEVIVPDGTVVQPSGMAFLASSGCVVPDSAVPSRLPDVEVQATTILGRLDIHTGEPRARRSLLRRRRRSSTDPSTPLTTDDGVVVRRDLARRVDAAPAGAVAPAFHDELAELDGVLANVLGPDTDMIGAREPADSGSGDTESAGVPPSEGASEGTLPHETLDPDLAEVGEAIAS